MYWTGDQRAVKCFSVCRIHLYHSSSNAHVICTLRHSMVNDGTRREFALYVHGCRRVTVACVDIWCEKASRHVATQGPPTRPPSDHTSTYILCGYLRRIPSALDFKSSLHAHLRILHTCQESLLHPPSRHCFTSHNPSNPEPSSQCSKASMRPTKHIIFVQVFSTAYPCLSIRSPID
jgi:hypothetical protein